MNKLTKPQKSVYNMEKFAGGSIATICSSMLHDGNVDVFTLQHAVNELYRLNDVLRTQIIETENGPMQRISTYDTQEFEVIYFQNHTEFTRYAENYAKQPIDIYGCLCDVKIVFVESSYGLLVKLHHIISDAWTMSLLARQFAEILDGNIPEVYQYSQYMAAEQKYAESKRYQKDKTFFVEQFQQCEEVLYLSDKKSVDYNAARKTVVLSKQETQKIISVAEKNNSSIFAVMATLFGIYFSRVKMNAEKFYIGTPVLNRAGVKEQNTAGMFINTVPLFEEIHYDKTFEENLATATDNIMSVLRHQHYNYEELLVELCLQYNFSEKLYDVILSYQNAKTRVKDFRTEWYSCGMQTESLQIHIDDRDDNGTLRINYDYRTALFVESEIDKINEHIFNLFNNALKNKDKKICELEFLSKNEENILLYDFNDTKVAYSKDKCIHQLFEQQAEKTPDKVAVIACDRTLTYAELNAEANRIAHSLIEGGVGVGDIVGFALPRKSYLITVMFGILKAGAVYLSIDPDLPQERRDFMLSDSGARMFIMESDINNLLLNNCDENPILDISSENICYCIYTSGTTGIPKGTLIRHRNFVNFCDKNSNNPHNCMINYGTRLISTFKSWFDAFGVDYALFLLNGCSIVLANDEEITCPDKLAKLMEKNNVDVIHSTPSILKMFCKNSNWLKIINKIKVITVAAESFPPDLYNYLEKYTSAIIFNGYGPSEATIGVTFGQILSKEITIGKPIANTQIYIVDQYMQQTPIGVTGELCIAGDGVGGGYLNRPELTAEKFIDNPFGEGKLYKTGDLAYWREDGKIVYVGRNDFQVKIRGLRIELGEIENAICGIEGVSQAVAVVRKNHEGRPLICAFYTGVEIEAKELRDCIGKKLPKYMLPHIYTHLEEMPLMSSGKISRKALPEVELYAIDTAVEYIAPKNERQKTLCKLIEAVLSTGPIGITEDFFDLGGDSLKAIEFVSKAHNEGIYFNLQSIYDYPTVKGLCECIENGDKQEVSFDDVDFTEIDKILEKNKLKYLKSPMGTGVGSILLAGATGYLGIHILADYLDNDTGIAYCLVRGKDKLDSTERLQNLLEFYFGDKYADTNRIEVICADLQKDNFSLSEEIYCRLTNSVDTVINCAASVKHYGSYKYFYETNVETTKQLIRFCQTANAKLIHTSTLSVSGNSFGDQFDGYISEHEKHFYENTLYIGQPLENVYARSKFEAEKLVLEAMADGLKANIMRMGNLTNRYSDAKFQKNYESNAFLNRVKGILDLGVFPDYLMDLYLEFTPIDDAARAVMTIARHFSTEQAVFHINSTKVVYMDKALEYFRGCGLNMQIVDGKKFTEILRTTAKQSGMEYIFETFINDMDENDKLNYDSNIRIENDFTVRYLKQLGFEWSDIDLDYIRRYVEYFKGIGYLGEHSI